MTQSCDQSSLAIMSSSSYQTKCIKDMPCLPYLCLHSLLNLTPQHITVWLCARVWHMASLSSMNHVAFCVSQNHMRLQGYCERSSALTALSEFFITTPRRVSLLLGVLSSDISSSLPLSLCAPPVSPLSPSLASTSCSPSLCAYYVSSTRTTLAVYLPSPPLTLSPSQTHTPDCW